MIVFPATLHRQVAELAGEFFANRASVDTVLVVNSCARGRATPESDLDMAVLVQPTLAAEDVRASEEEWRRFVAAQPTIAEFKQAGAFAHVHLDLFDGRFVPSVWDEGGGPDTFEVELVNRVAYAIREQVEGWLELPDLYRQLPPILSVRQIESDELVKRADALHSFLRKWVQL